MPTYQGEPIDIGYFTIQVRNGIGLRETLFIDHIVRIQELPNDKSLVHFTSGAPCEYPYTYDEIAKLINEQVNGIEP